MQKYFFPALVTSVTLVALVTFLALVTSSVLASSSWIEQDSGTLQSLRAIAKTDGTLIAGGNTGYLMRSIDEGQTWSRIEQFSSTWWHDLEMEPDGDVVAVGDGGSYAVSSNAGVTWVSSSLGVSVNLFDIERTQSNGYIVGDSGTALYYSDNSKNWHTTSTGVTDNLYAVQDMGDGTAWMAGSGGRLLRVSQSGLSFANLGRVVVDNIRGLYFTSASTGWIVGEKGTFKKTTDGGTSWVAVSVSGLVSQDLFDIKAFGDDIVVVGDKIIIQSQDGGVTWSTTDFTSDNITFYAAVFDSDGELWAAGTDYDVKSAVFHYQEEVVEVDEVVEVEEEEGEEVEAQAASLIKLACVGETLDSDPCRAVYYYATDGKRHAFTNENVFFTWFDDFDDVVEVSADFMSDLMLGANVTYHPGTRMVKFQSTHTVYTVSVGGVLRAIASEDIAEGLYGADWNQQIDDISDSFFGDYTFGEVIDSVGDYDVEEDQESVQNLDDNF
jgi:photosystem II stability/assembly factor-like uncharacterized protein